MGSNERQLEQSVLDSLKNKLATYSSRIEDLGLSIAIPGLRRYRTQSSQYESEAAVNFTDQNGVFDVIEFFVYRAGEPVASMKEIDSWLEETLADVVRRRAAFIAENPLYMYTTAPENT